MSNAVKVHSSAGVQPLWAIRVLLALQNPAVGLGWGWTYQECLRCLWWVQFLCPAQSRHSKCCCCSAGSWKCLVMSKKWDMWKMGYLVSHWGHLTQGMGAITGNQNSDVFTKVWLPRSVVSGCTEIGKPGNPISRNNSTWRETGVSLIGPLEQVWKNSQGTAAASVWGCTVNTCRVCVLRGWAISPDQPGAPAQSALAGPGSWFWLPGKFVQRQTPHQGTSPGLPLAQTLGSVRIKAPKSIWGPFHVYPRYLLMTVWIGLRNFCFSSKPCWEKLCFWRMFPFPHSSSLLWASCGCCIWGAGSLDTWVGECPFYLILFC